MAADSASDSTKRNEIIIYTRPGGNVRVQMRFTGDDLWMSQQQMGELFGVTRLSEFGISHVSDNVVLLQFLRGDSRIKRGITVMKTRASAHDPQIREFDITGDGFVVGDHFAVGQDLA